MNDDEKKDDIEIVADTEEENNLPDLQKKTKKIKEDLKRCEAEKREYLEGWQRAKADHINYRRDENKRFSDMAIFATADFIQEVLPVLDSFDLAFNHNLAPEIEKGIFLIRSQLEDVLKRKGLEQIKTKAGDEFNPEWHESIGEVESDLPEGKIAEVVQKGYSFQDKALRPTRVKIAKSK